MTGKRPSADILPYDEWKAALRKSPPSASGSLIAAAANERRVVEALARRTAEALAELSTRDDLPSDVEPRA